MTVRRSINSTYRCEDVCLGSDEIWILLGSHVPKAFVVEGGGGGTWVHLFVRYKPNNNKNNNASF